MATTSSILVTGGTGTLGRHVVPRLQERGNSVRVFSRRNGSAENGIQRVTGDLLTGEGIAAAVEGVAAIVHCAGSPTGDPVMVRHLVQAVAERAPSAHLLYISVVGADRVPIRSRFDRTVFGYFGAKLAAERILAASGLRWTILRATQFHESLPLVARQLAKLPIVPIPAGFRFQPLDADDVAARIVALTLIGPAGLAGEIAGPTVYSAVELFRSYLNVTHRRRLIVSVRLPGRAAQAIRAGALLAPEQAAATGHAGGRRTWEEFLIQHFGRATTVTSPA
jgi:uncharacterized protein YbjT (DUF2867 family)